MNIVGMFGIGLMELIVILVIGGLFAGAALVVLLAVLTGVGVIGNRNLAPCPDCGRKISPQAPTCPNCGRPSRPEA